ncbi:MAG: hypothetical protein F4X80_10165 [Chloroflexi bacterium]|nr:hypothetical protein [Chloroflexota bacterium]MXW24536.1 hypothetical protein [Chloroflexota bacterium]MXZ63817.1 hypothetical protein [Chloroflexota bacterium]MYE32994.1 hypothetical protein [Chloroflexota bacterium]
MGGRYPPGEVAARGDAIYEKIKPRLGDLDKGTFVVIDIESGDYEIDAEDIKATMRLRERRPSAVTWAARVGYRAAYSHVGLLPVSERDA